MSQLHTFVPLLEHATRIGGIELYFYSGVSRVRRENRPAPIGRTVVENDQFEVFIRLPQNTVDALLQETCVVVARNYNGNFWDRSIHGPAQYLPVVLLYATQCYGNCRQSRAL